MIENINAGQIIVWPNYFIPRNHKLCDGELLNISDYPDLFDIIGNTYGGDGNHNFRLPDLRGRVALGSGTRDGLSYYRKGDTGGSAFIELSKDDMPSHTHTARLMGSTETGNTNDPVDNSFASVEKKNAKRYSTSEPDIELHHESVYTKDTGNEQAKIDNRMQSLVLHFIIKTRNQD